MATIIGLIVIYTIFFKFFPICIKQSKEFCKAYNFDAVPLAISKEHDALRNYFKVQGEYRDSFNQVKSPKGGFDIYIDKHGNKYMQGLFTCNDIFVSGNPPTVLIADIAHYGQYEWQDEYGRYEAVTTYDEKAKKPVPLANYFRYYPEVCPICGEPIIYNSQKYPFDNSEMLVAAPSDSHDRYCSHCNEILKRDTYTYYPFFIDTINRKLITSKDRDEFDKYMMDCINIHNIDKWIEDTPEGDRDWITFDETLLTKKHLSEYTKNSEVAPMWQRLKVLR